MTSTAIALVLLSTLLHTAWNSAAKQADDKLLFLTWLLPVCALIALPGALAAYSLGGRLSWPAIAAALTSATLWSICYQATAKAYEGGDLSVMYPLMRGTTPLLTALMCLRTEPPTPAGWVALVLITVAVVLLSGGDKRVERPTNVALAAGVLVALITALYAVVDAWGVRHGNQPMYMLVENAASAVLLMTWVSRQRGAAAVRDFGRAYRRPLVLAAFGSYGAYGLVLLALQQAPVAYVTALRATAVLWSVLYGCLALREPALRRRLLYGSLMVLGVVLLKLWGTG